MVLLKNRLLSPLRVKNALQPAQRHVRSCADSGSGDPVLSAAALVCFPGSQEEHESCGMIVPLELKLVSPGGAPPLGIATDLPFPLKAGHRVVELRLRRHRCPRAGSGEQELKAEGRLPAAA